MSYDALQLLATFESLSPREQRELLAVMLRRSGELPDIPLNDDHLIGLADELFQTLDAQESDGSPSASR